MHLNMEIKFYKECFHLALAILHSRASAIIFNVHKTHQLTYGNMTELCSAAECLVKTMKENPFSFDNPDLFALSAIKSSRDQALK